MSLTFKVVVEVVSQPHQLPTMVVALLPLSNILLPPLLLEPQRIHQHLPKTHPTHPRFNTMSHPRLQSRPTAMWRETQS